MRPGKEELKARVCAEIDRRAEDIVATSAHIMRNPESGFRETKTAQYVCARLDQMGLAYRSGLALTGVKARMSGRTPGPTVGILGELDSLIVSDHPFADPVTGAAHACGHHAQVASMLGAGLGLQVVMDQLDGDVVLFAVPAEECIEVDWRLGLRQEKKIEFIVGKPELIRLGEFDDVDMVTITHTPARADGSLATVGDTHNGCLVKRARFVGRASHAGGAPHLGVNALKAATLALHAIEHQRETFRDEDGIRVHPIITRGGEAVSAIPADVRVEMLVRGRTIEAIADASAKVDRSLRSGAQAMGATVEIITISGYLPNQSDPNLVALAYASCADVVGKERMGTARHVTGSTDVGDLAAIMPTVHPRSGGTQSTPHSNDYVVVDHRLAAVNPAKSMAMMAVDLLWDRAREARRVMAEAGKKMTREEYVALRRRLDGLEVYGA